MANKTFVAKNGLTANTANVFMSQLSGTLTPTAAGAIVIVDGTGQLGTRTEAQILTDIGAIASSSAIDSVTAGNGLTGGGTEGDVTVTLGTPATLNVSGTNTVGGTDHQHAITTSADTSSGTQAILASDSSGDLKVANFETGAALTVGTDLVVKDDVSLDSDGAVLGFGIKGEIISTIALTSAMLYGSSRMLRNIDAEQKRIEGEIGENALSKLSPAQYLGGYGNMGRYHDATQDQMGGAGKKDTEGIWSSNKMIAELLSHDDVITRTLENTTDKNLVDLKQSFMDKTEEDVDV